MKQLILNALKAKFEGISESILNRIADKLAKTVTKEDEVATAVEGVTFANVLESYGDSRATEASQSAVVNYEKKHGLKEGQKAIGGEPTLTIEPTPDGNNTPAWAIALIESNKALGAKVAAIEGAKTVDIRKQQLSKITEKLPEALRKPYTRLTVEGLSDDEFAVLTADIQKEVDGLCADLSAKGAAFQRPIGSGTTTKGEPTKEEAEAIVDAMGL